MSDMKKRAVQRIHLQSIAVNYSFNLHNMQNYLQASAHFIVRQCRSVISSVTCSNKYLNVPPAMMT